MKFFYSSYFSPHAVEGFNACRRTAARHAVLLNANNVRPSIHDANLHAVFEFFHILTRYFHETRGSLNFLTVHSCSQNHRPISDKLYVCVELSTKTDADAQWCKTPSSAFSKKISATTPKFMHVFGRAPSDLQLCFVQLLKTRAPSARCSTFKYPVTLKPGLGVTQGHRKL